MIVIPDDDDADEEAGDEQLVSKLMHLLSVV